MAEEVKKKHAHEEKPLEKMTVTELREIARDIPRSVAVHDMKKEELLVLIKEHRGIKDEEPAKKKAGAGEATLNLTELKQKINRLKEEKTEARQAKNHKRVDTLRRHISRLKKRTRRLAAA